MHRTDLDEALLEGARMSHVQSTDEERSRAEDFSV